jgi:uncharacterized protein (DUF2252 family)
MSKQPSPRSSSIIDAIFSNNAGRDPERLALKYSKMAQNPFIFLRGACHLFYDGLPDSPAINCFGYRENRKQRMSKMP